MADDEKARPIALVEVEEGNPDAPPMTISEFREWRRREDQRTLADLQAQIEAYLELQAGETVQ